MGDLDLSMNKVMEPFELKTVKTRYFGDTLVMILMVLMLIMKIFKHKVWI